VSDSARRAERLRGFFGLQLKFAERMGEALGLSFSEAAVRYTNLHRRLGLGRPDRPAPANKWSGYGERLDQLERSAQRLDFIVEAVGDAPAEAPPEPQIRFGCFAFEPPDGDGRVRFHFHNADTEGDVGPLSRTKIDRRRGELRALFAHLHEAYPSARTVQGGSWLYNLAAYRRLFPPIYAESGTPMERPRLTGSSTWGQLLRHDDTVNPTVERAFLAGLDRLQPHAPWTVFPMRALSTRAPLEAFMDFY